MEEVPLPMKTGHSGPVAPIPTILPTPVQYERAGPVGFRTQWVLFVLMLLASATFAGLSWPLPVSRRLYHVLLATATVVSALTYFALAAGQGSTLNCVTTAQNLTVPAVPPAAEALAAAAAYGHRHGGHVTVVACRQVQWARYVDWTLTAPLLLAALFALAGVDGARTLTAGAAAAVAQLSGLFAALGRARTAQRWGWYVIAWLAYLVVVWHVAVNGRRAARARGGAGSASASGAGGPLGKAFGSLAAYSLVLSALYLIIWALGPLSHRIDVDAEIISYALLDVLAKAGLGVWLLVYQRRLPEANIDLDGYWTHGLGGEGRIRIGDEEGH